MVRNRSAKSQILAEIRQLERQLSGQPKPAGRTARQKVLAEITQLEKQIGARRAVDDADLEDWTDEIVESDNQVIDEDATAVLPLDDVEAQDHNETMEDSENTSPEMEQDQDDMEEALETQDEDEDVEAMMYGQDDEDEDEDDLTAQEEDDDEEDEDDLTAQEEDDDEEDEDDLTAQEDDEDEEAYVTSSEIEPGIEDAISQDYLDDVQNTQGIDDSVVTDESMLDTAPTNYEQTLKQASARLDRIANYTEKCGRKDLALAIDKISMQIDQKRVAMLFARKKAAARAKERMAKKTRLRRGR